MPTVERRALYGFCSPLIPPSIAKGPFMRIDVIGKHIEITDAIRAFAETKSGKLTRYLDGMIQRITVRLEPDPRKKGFHAEVVADVEHHEDFVSNAHHEDMYAAIDLAVDKSARQLAEFKDQLKQSKRGGQAAG